MRCEVVDPQGRFLVQPKSNRFVASLVKACIDRIHQDSAIPFWGTRFDVELAPLDIEPDPTADRHVRGTLVAGRPIAELPVGGDCAIDAVDGQAPGERAVAVSAPVAEVEGWARLPNEGNGPAPGVRLALTDPEGRTWYSAASRSERPDVDAYFHLATPAHVGYTGTVDLRSLQGGYTLHIVQDGDDGPLTCASNTADIIRR